jgi:hypothetical protein
VDIDPIFAEITIRRLERLRRTGKVGWQFMSPFPEAKVKLEIGNNEETKPKESLPGTS